MTESFQRLYVRLKRIASDPLLFLTFLGAYASLLVWSAPSVLRVIAQGPNEWFFESILSPQNIIGVIGLLFGFLFISRYLGIFSTEPVGNETHKEATVDNQNLLREIRNYVVHAPHMSESSPTQINIDEAFQGQLLARLTTESQSALASFIDSEVFKKAADSRFKEGQIVRTVDDIYQMTSTYQREMVSWRKNANLNLLIGLLCAVVGIGVMWQTLATLNFELEAGASWRITDLYRFLARLGLVLIVESVAFFFLKLYREDRSMIRYLRNEITNLESKCLSLKTALSFGSAADISKVLQSLSSTERNFLVKKGERVMSDVTYENSEILLEKLLGRYPELLGKIAKSSVENR